MIVLTDGVDVMSKHSLNQAVESALRSDTAVYSILVSPAVLLRESRYHPTPLILSRNQILIQRYNELNLAKGRAALSSIFGQTGGCQFEVTAAKSVKSIYAAITDELRSQYRIGLSFEADGLKPGYHSLSLTTTRSGVSVQSWQGFFWGDQDVHLPPDPVVAAARLLALTQHDSPIGFVANENVECYGLGNGASHPVCNGAGKIIFDETSRTVQRQVTLSAGETRRIVGASSFGEYGVELANIFRSLPDQQLQPTERGQVSAAALRQFDFVVDSKSSTWQVWDGERWLAIPYMGAIWIDPADNSIRRLQRTSNHLPSGMPGSLIQSDIEFAPVTVGGTRIPMLPTRTIERICKAGDDLCTEIFSVVQSYSGPSTQPPSLLGVGLDQTLPQPH